MSKEQDQAFFRNFSLIVGALAVMMVIFFIAAHIVTDNPQAEAERQKPQVAERTKPMGEVNIAGEEEESAMEVADTGAMEVADAGEGATAGGSNEVYDGLCVSCHGSGIPGIPQTGDVDAWAPRIAQGMDTLYKHALEGFTGESGMMMMPRGGNPDLTDDQVKSAVDYIVDASK
jgi:cytochrome c5